MLSITMGLDEFRRHVTNARDVAALRLSDAMNAEAQRVIDEQRRWWRRPLFSAPLTLEDALALVADMVTGQDKHVRDVAARRLGLHNGWRLHRRMALLDLAAVAARLDRMSLVVGADGIKHVSLRCDEADALFGRST